MTTAVRETTIAARVPVDLRTDLEAIRQRSGDPDLSHTIRRILRAGADRELAPAPPLRGLLGWTTDGGTSRANDRPTAKAAGHLLKPPRANSQRRRVLELFVGRQVGLTTDEVVEILQRTAPHWPQNSIARRVTDLLEGDAIESATFDFPGGSKNVVRPTRAGREAQAWRITARGQRWLEQENPTP